MSYEGSVVFVATPDENSLERVRSLGIVNKN